MGWLGSVASEKLKSPKGRLSRLLKSRKSDTEILEELFLATLCRYPNEFERDQFAKHKAVRKTRQDLFVDTLWSLLNTKEFILNH